MDISRQQIEETVAKMKEACPEIEECGVTCDALFTMANDAGMSVMNEIRRLSAKGIDRKVVVAFMAIGVQAAFLDALGPDDPQLKIYRAGRVVGRFVADRIAEEIRLHAEGNPQ